MDLKTIALDSRPAVAERKEYDRGNNDGQRGESADLDAGKEYWAGAVGTADSLAAGRIGVRHSDNPDLVQVQMGDDGDRLTNGREYPGNQGWEIEPLAAGPGTHLRRRNAEYR